MTQQNYEQHLSLARLEMASPVFGQAAQLIVTVFSDVYCGTQNTSQRWIGDRICRTSSEGLEFIGSGRGYKKPQGHLRGLPEQAPALQLYCHGNNAMKTSLAGSTRRIEMTEMERKFCGDVVNSLSHPCSRRKIRHSLPIRGHMQLLCCGGAAPNRGRPAAGLHPESGVHIKFQAVPSFVAPLCRQN